ncbi:MAG: ABC transporter ATP-binding protein/permease [Deltaproteobacteria bacterium]|nr:ABC transporter ATP-binding protein/permease [Deltaproteobacteria bacterium]
MHGNYGYFEEGKLGKPYDWPLWSRLARFGRPYLRVIGLSGALILLLTVFDLALPYLLKVGIDSYIVLSARPVRVPEDPPPELKLFLDKVGSQLYQGSGAGQFFVAGDTLRRLDPRLLRKLEAQGFIAPKRFYFTQIQTSAQEKVVLDHPNLFHTTDDMAFIDYSDLAKLSGEEILSLRRHDISGLYRLGLLFVSLLLLSAVCTFGQNLLMVYAGQHMMHDLRMKLFGHLQEMSLSFFDRNPVGRLVTRLTNDIQNLDEMFGSVIMTLLKDTVLLGGILVILFSLEWELTLVTLSVMPLIIVLFRVFGVQVRGAFREIRAKLARINSTLNEYLSGIRVIQLFRQEKETLHRFENLNHEYYRATVKQIMLQAVFFPCIELLATTTIALLLWYGGRQVLVGRISLGVLVVFISYLRMFFGPIRDVSQKYSIMQSAMASAERIFLLLDDTGQEKYTSTGAEPPAVQGEIEFRQVSFGYRPDEPVLKDISFRVRAGETLAIVGVTGAGKTTLMHLLERFHQPQQGKILLDGRDIRDLDLAWLRSQVGLIMQDVFLFRGKLRDNIALDRNLSPKEIQEITRMAYLEDLVCRLPDQLDAEVQEGGVTFSTGQRQLLAIARAMAYDPKVLILDEATANIDSETEHLIQQALERLFQGRTTLVIAHRLSTIQKADRVLVMHHGRIVEHGTQDDLLSRRNYYYRLHQLQFASP